MNPSMSRGIPTAKHFNTMDLLTHPFPRRTKSLLRRGNFDICKFELKAVEIVVKLIILSDKYTNFSILVIHKHKICNPLYLLPRKK